MSYIRGKFYTYKGDKMYMFGHLKGVPEKVVDEFVVMRFAQMTKKQIKVAEKRAIKKHRGNFSCDPLCKKYGLKTIMDMINIDDHD